MIFKPITTDIPNINGTDQSNYLLVTKNIIVIHQQNIRKSEIFYLNLNTKAYQKIFVCDKYSNIFNYLFPIGNYLTFSSVIYFLSKKNHWYCKLYWLNYNRRIFLKIKLFINNPPHDYCQNVEKIKGIDESKYLMYQMLGLSVCDQNCHLFMTDKISNHVIHMKVNDATNKLETLHVIDWINITLSADGIKYQYELFDNSITSNYKQSSIMISQSELMISQSESMINNNRINRNSNNKWVYNFSNKKCVYNCYMKNKWTRIEKMKHNDQSMSHLSVYVTKLYFPNDNIEIRMDGISQNISAIIFNENNKLIKLKCILPMCGYYEAWLSDENKRLDDLLIHGFVRNEHKINEFQLLPIYLIEIIIKYYWSPMMNIILKEYFGRNHEFLFDTKDRNKQLLQCWSLNCFQLWDE